MRTRPIRVIPDEPFSKLDPESRLDFSSVHTIQHNLKLKSFGMVERDTEALVTQFENVWFGIRDISRWDTAMSSRSPSSPQASASSRIEALQEPRQQMNQPRLPNQDPRIIRSQPSSQTQSSSSPQSSRQSRNPTQLTKQRRTPPARVVEYNDSSRAGEIGDRERGQTRSAHSTAKTTEPVRQPIANQREEQAQQLRDFIANQMQRGIHKRKRSRNFSSE